MVAVTAVLTAWGTVDALEAYAPEPATVLAALNSNDDDTVSAPQDDVDPAPDGDSAVGSASSSQDTLLLIVAREGEPAISLTLLAGAADGGRASVVFLPTGTLAEIPGFGMERLASALRFGGGELAEASVENLLGLEIDHHVVVTPKLLGNFLGRADGIEVTLDQRLVDRTQKAGPEVAFPAGSQQLDGPAAARFWTFNAEGDEFDQLERQQALWSGLLQAIAADDAVRGRMLGDGAPQLRPQGLDEGEAGFVSDLMGGLADARAADALGFDLLPVSVFGTADGKQTYRLREAETETLVTNAFAPSRPASSDGGRLRVQVLNGVGTPGIGRAVDKRLEGEPVRVVLTDNAVNFEQQVTRILVYDDQPATRAAAEQVRSRLGVGTIELSRQPQSVVDLTIVVGADFAQAAD